MLLRSAYYLLKPALPWRLRMALRRIVARRVRKRIVHGWPINQVAGRRPEGFPGWPAGKQFAFVLTHDVESKRGLGRIRELAGMEMRLGFRSSFNLIPEGDYATLESPRAWLAENGFEVGVHDLRHDGRLFSSRKSFLRDGQRINHYLKEWQAVGFRAGFMLRELHWLRDLNIHYDASTFDTDPFEPQSEGVNTIFPFWVPREDHSGYVELPYTLPQDSTLFLVLQEKSTDTWKRKLDWIAEHGGMALMSAHPDYMNFDGAPGPGEYNARLYEEFLQYVLQQYGDKCWRALPREVADYSAQLFQPELTKHPAASAAVPSDVCPPAGQPALVTNSWRLRAKRAAMVTFSPYPGDPRPRRAVDALVSEGMSVDLVCLAANEKEPLREVRNGVDIIRLPIEHRRGGALAYAYSYSSFILLSSLLLALRTLTRGYELVYVHNMPDILVASSLFPKLFGARVVLDLHDPMPELMMTIARSSENGKAVRLLKRLEKWSLGRADAVLTVNLACKKIFGARSCPPEKINVVMNSPDGEIFRFRPADSTEAANGRPGRPFVIMYHGSLVERNGVDLAVDALALVRDRVPQAELRIYGGKTPFLERVMDSVRSRGLQDVVHHMGPRKLEDIVLAIGECDVGVIPNHRNIFTELNTPTRIFEYLACGKPVIAPRAPGIQDYFSENALYSFELGDAADLARQIEHVYTHPGEVGDVVKRGQAVYLAHTWPQQRQILVRTVSELLEDESPRAGTAAR